MRTLTLPADTYRVRFSAYCGMSYDMATGLDKDQARATLARLIVRRKATGHPVTQLAIGAKYEFAEPEGCALIPDTAGVAWLERETVPAFECFLCGCLTARGETCTCQEPCDDDDDEAQ